MSRLLLALLLLPVVGCASVDLTPLDEPGGPPGPSLAIAPLKVTYTATADRPELETIGSWERVECARCQEEIDAVEEVRPASCPDCKHQRVRSVFSAPYAPRLRTEGVSDKAVELLRERASFAAVTRLEAGDRPALLEGARAAQAKWLLEVELSDLRARLIEKNGWHVPKIVTFIVCALLIFPAVDPFNWFIPGENYGIEATLRWRLWDVEAGERLDSGREEALIALDAFAAFGLGSIPGRPWFLVGFLRTPGCLDEEDWEGISDQLLEQAEQRLTLELVRTAEKRRGTAK